MYRLPLSFQASLSFSQAANNSLSLLAALILSKNFSFFSGVNKSSPNNSDISLIVLALKILPPS